jgi:hypothetical protein
MSQVGFGIVGTGMIAGVVADAIAKAKDARLAAVSSRRLENAQQFVGERPGTAAVEGLESLLARPDVDAVYVATRTVAKEDIALGAIAAGKHVLVDKPFVDHASALRMTRTAESKRVVFMDATHFVHHPRTAAIRAAYPATIGAPRSLHTTDVGYTAATLIMDLDLVGTTGVIGMDDFVLDWEGSFAFRNPAIKAGYSVRTGMATRTDATFVPTPSRVGPEIAMIENFAAMAVNGDPILRAAFANASLQTQEYLDALWSACDS